jgi:hypothetical protein
MAFIEHSPTGVLLCKAIGAYCGTVLLTMLWGAVAGRFISIIVAFQFEWRLRLITNKPFDSWIGVITDNEMKGGYGCLSIILALGVDWAFHAYGHVKLTLGVISVSILSIWLVPILGPLISNLCRDALVVATFPVRYAWYTISYGRSGEDSARTYFDASLVRIASVRTQTRSVRSNRAIIEALADVDHYGGAAILEQLAREVDPRTRERALSLLLRWPEINREALARLVDDRVVSGPSVMRTFSERDSEALLEIAKESSYKDTTRAAALDRLAEVTSNANALISSLRDIVLAEVVRANGSSTIVTSAIEHLQKLGADSVRTLNELLHSASSLVHVPAAKALALQGERGARLLYEATDGAGTSDFSVFAHAIAAYSKSGVGYLEKLLGKSIGESRQVVLKLVADNCGPEIVPAVASVLTDIDPSEPMALQTLLTIEKRCRGSLTQSHTAQLVLRNSAEVGSPQVRTLAIELLEMAGVCAQRHLLVLASNTEFADRPLALRSLSRIADVTAIVTLTQLFDDKDSATAIAAIEACCETLRRNGAVATDDLIKALAQASRTYIDSKAFDALALLGAAATQTLCTRLHEHGGSQPALRALAQVADPAALPELLPFVVESVTEERKLALEALVAILHKGSTSVKSAQEQWVTALLIAGMDGQEGCSSVAVAALASIQGNQAAKALVDLVGMANEAGQIAAAQVLFKTEVQDRLTLERTLCNENPKVREIARLHVNVGQQPPNWLTDAYLYASSSPAQIRDLDNVCSSEDSKQDTLTCLLDKLPVKTEGQPDLIPVVRQAAAMAFLQRMCQSPEAATSLFSDALPMAYSTSTRDVTDYVEEPDPYSYYGGTVSTPVTTTVTDYELSQSRVETVRQRLSAALNDAHPPFTLANGDDKAASSLRTDLASSAIERGMIETGVLRDPRISKFLQFLRERRLEDIVVFGGTVRDLLFDLPVSDLDIAILCPSSGGLPAVDSERARWLATRGEALATEVAEALGCSRRALEADGDAAFCGLPVQYAGPFLRQSEEQLVLLAGIWVDRSTRQVHSPTSGAALLSLAIDCDARVYGQTEAIRAAADGTALLERTTSDLTMGMILRTLRLVHQLGLQLSPQDEDWIIHQLQEMQAGKVRIHPGTSRSRALVGKILDTARNPARAHYDLLRLGISRILAPGQREQSA